MDKNDIMLMEMELCMKAQTKQYEFHKRMQFIWTAYDRLRETQKNEQE